MAQCPCPDRECPIGMHAPTEPAEKHLWAHMFEAVDRRARWWLQNPDSKAWEPQDVPGAVRLTAGMSVIAWVMHEWAGPDGTGIRAGNARLVVACKVHKATIHRRKPDLLKSGWILQSYTAGRPGQPRKNVNVYQLAIPVAYSDYLAELRQIADRRGRHARA